MLEDGGDARVLGALGRLLLGAGQRLRRHVRQELNGVDLGVGVDARLVRLDEELPERPAAQAHGDEHEGARSLLAGNLADGARGIERVDVLDDERRVRRQRLAQVSGGRRQLHADELLVVAGGVDDARPDDAVALEQRRQERAVAVRDLARGLEDERGHVGVGIEQPLGAVVERVRHLRAQLRLLVHSRALDGDRFEGADGLERAQRRIGQRRLRLEEQAQIADAPIFDGGSWTSCANCPSTTWLRCAARRCSLRRGSRRCDEPRRRRARRASACSRQRDRARRVGRSSGIGRRWRVTRWRATRARERTAPRCSHRCTARYRSVTVALLALARSWTAIERHLARPMRARSHAHPLGVMFARRCRDRSARSRRRRARRSRRALARLRAGDSTSNCTASPASAIASLSSGRVSARSSTPPCTPGDRALEAVRAPAVEAHVPQVVVVDPDVDRRGRRRTPSACRRADAWDRRCGSRGGDERQAKRGHRANRIGGNLPRTAAAQGRQILPRMAARAAPVTDGTFAASAWIACDGEEREGDRLLGVGVDAASRRTARTGIGRERDARARPSASRLCAPPPETSTSSIGAARQDEAAIAVGDGARGEGDGGGEQIQRRAIGVARGPGERRRRAP